MPDAPGPDDGRASEPNETQAPPPPAPPPPAPPALPPPSPPPPADHGTTPRGPAPWGAPGTLGGSGPPALASAPSPYANYGARVGAWLIDWVITSIIGSIVLVPLHAVHQVTTGAADTTQPRPPFGLTITNQGALLFVLIVIIYTTAFTGSSRGQTLGMMAVRARAVDAAGGGPIGHARALGRVLVEYVLFVALFAPWVLDMLFPLWDPRRQTLHDKVTNTVVIKA
jgi:uncharacterized RDD family membrane protein YckC